MTFAHNKSWEHFETVFNSKLPIKEAWDKIIDFHEKTVPTCYWTQLRELDVETEQQEIKEWFEQLVANDPLPQKVISIWIGIVKLLDDNDNKVNAIYLTGADSYDKDDIEWATEPTYEPENKYGVLDILNQIENIIKEDPKNYSFLDWILPLAYCSLTIDEIVRRKLDPSIFLKSQKKLFVTTGHDSGDYMNLSPIE
ncbi:MAG: hypothetical protein H7Y13_09005 [Sphingobacteriaceae bacterium]|nr:hypothetical protein [Sphingobacteriaceae bacterium]